MKIANEAEVEKLKKGSGFSHSVVTS